MKASSLLSTYNIFKSRVFLRNPQTYQYSSCVNQMFTQTMAKDVHAINYRRQLNFSCRHFSSTQPTQTSILKILSESAPVIFSQELLVSFHDWSGLPWWATIVASTVFLRTIVTLPLSVYQTYILAKYENLYLKMPSIVEELRKETAYAIKKFQWTEKDAKIMYNHSLNKQWKKLVEEENCHPMKASILVLVQLPMWIILSASLRNLVFMSPSFEAAAEIVSLQLSVGGILWFPNLTVGDGTFILPITLGLINLAIVEFQSLSRKNEPSKLQRYATNMFRAVSIVMIPVAANVPSCLALYWVTSSFFGLCQNVLLISPTVRRLCHIPVTKSSLHHPYKDIKKKITDKFNNIY